jgi:hypothetical protein
MNRKIFELESKISEKIKSDNGRTVHFEYIKEQVDRNGILISPCKVSTWTFDSIITESFLLKSMEGEKYEDCLEKILEYVESIPNSKHSYTVTWRKTGLVGLNTSYFYCKDVVEVVEKFFEGKEINEYKIFKIELMPIS